MTKKLSDKEKVKRSYIRKFRKADPEGLGPYNIIWEGKTPFRAVTDPDSKTRQIIISEPYTKDQPETEEHVAVRASSTLAHEIAHSRLSKSDHLTDEEFAEQVERSGKVRPIISLDPHGQWVGVTHSDTYSDQVSIWKELDAVFHQVAKGWDYERWLLLSQLHDGADYFGDGSFRDGKRVAKAVLEHQIKRGHITKAESRKAMKEIDAITVEEWNYYEGTYHARLSEGSAGGSYIVRHLIEGGIDDNN